MSGGVFATGEDHHLTYTATFCGRRPEMSVLLLLFKINNNINKATLAQEKSSCA